jgi:ubiquinol-cytochrome c reductase core subunit 2
VDVVPTLVRNTFNKSFEVYELLRAQKAAADQTNTALSDPVTLVTEKLHQVAFRKGLGNTIFASKAAASEITRDDVSSFANIPASRIAVVATGVAHSDLKPLVEEALASIKFPSGTNEASKSAYFGGEARIEGGPKSSAVFAVAFPGASFTSTQFASSLILKELLNGDGHLKYSNQNKLSTPHTSVSGLNYNYTDAGIVGFIVTGKALEVKEAAQKSLGVLKGAASISNEAFEAAKNAAIVAAESGFTRGALLEALGKEAVTGSSQVSSTAAIESVTKEDFVKVFFGLI